MPFGIGQNIVPGGLEAINSALQRRRLGDSTSPLSQVSGAAPTPNNPNLQGPPTSAPTGALGGAIGGGGDMAGGPTPQPGLTAPIGGGTSESELIIKALTNRLNAISKREAPPTPSAGASPLGGPSPLGGSLGV